MAVIRATTGPREARTEIDDHGAQKITEHREKRVTILDHVGADMASKVLSNKLNPMNELKDPGAAEVLEDTQ